MNNRLRKRFLGAGVVVALAAMILPFLLQGEGYKANRQLAEDAQTRIPPRPPASVSLDTSALPPSEDVRTALMEPESLPEPVPAPLPEPSPALPVASKPVPSEPVKPKPAPEVTPTPKPSTGVNVKPLDKPLEKPAEKLPAQPIQSPASKTPEKTAVPPLTKPVEATPGLASAKSEAWLIQLGSFTAESNAQNLLAQVRRVGVSAKVERIEIKGSPVWRVTSGTYATRAEADAALNVLKTRLNLGGMVRSAR